MNDSRAFLRHMLATLAYRGGKALRHAPSGFGDFHPVGIRNTPVLILAHIGDLLAWSHRWCQGDAAYQVSAPLAWDDEVARFHTLLAEFDAWLASGAPMQASYELLFQGPIADAFTHVGQLTLLRRMAGSPVLGEAYRAADIQPGRVGPEQSPPGREFALDQGALWSPKHS